MSKSSAIVAECQAVLPSVHLMILVKILILEGDALKHYFFSHSIDDNLPWEIGNILADIRSLLFHFDNVIST